MTNTIARFLFVLTFVSIGVGLVAWETTTLLAINKKSKNNSPVLVLDGRSGKEPVLGVSAEGDDDSLSEMKVTVTTDDARPILLKKYLEKYKSPLVPYSDLIFSMSQDYGYDYRWIVAIAQQESNLCKKIPEESYNCWGYGIHKKGTLRFENYELAIKSFGEYLKREYFDKGMNTPELIMKKYCPSSNGSWAFGVNHFFEEIEKG